MLPFTVHPVGDSALLAVFTQCIAPEIGAAVAALNTRVLSANISGGHCIGGGTVSESSH